MKFNRVDLLESCKLARKQLEVGYSNALGRYAYEEYTRKDKWLNEYGDSWRALANTIQRNLDSYNVIVADDLPSEIAQSNYGMTLKLYRPDVPPTAPDYSILDSLEALLSSTTDEFVTSTDLKSMGYNARWLVGLMALASNTNTEETNK